MPNEDKPEYSEEENVRRQRATELSDEMRRELDEITKQDGGVGYNPQDEWLK